MARECGNRSLFSLYQEGSKRERRGGERVEDLIDPFEGTLLVAKRPPMRSHPLRVSTMPNGAKDQTFNKWDLGEGTYSDLQWRISIVSYGIDLLFSDNQGFTYVCAYFIPKLLKLQMFQVLQSHIFQNLKLLELCSAQPSPVTGRVCIPTSNKCSSYDFVFVLTFISLWSFASHARLNSDTEPSSNHCWIVWCKYWFSPTVFFS